MNASSGHVEPSCQLGTFLGGWECCASIRLVEDFELGSIGPLALLFDNGFFGDQHRSRLLREHTVGHMASGIWGRTMCLNMRRDAAFGWIHASHGQLMGVMEGGLLRVMAAWIGDRRIGIRGMRLELGVFGRIGCGRRANVGVVGEVGTDRTIPSALPAVVSDRSRRRHAEWRKLARAL